MKKLNYKLIVSDFDGTLADDDGNIPVNVKDAITEYVQNGGIFSVCSGRILKSILPRVRELGLKGLVIGSQGSVIADIESGIKIKNFGLDYKEVAQICENFEDLGRLVNIYCDDDLYTAIPQGTDYLELYEKITGVKSISVEGKMSEFVLKNKLKCQKVACLVAYEERDKLYSDIKERLNGKFDITCSAKVLVEISPLGQTKGEAVKYLCEHFNIDPEKCIAIGDNLNDASMINFAGLGVAVGNADIALKNIADIISVTNNEGAVAQIINKYGFA